PRGPAAEGDQHSGIAGRGALAYRPAVAVRESGAGSPRQFGWDDSGALAVGGTDETIIGVADRAAASAARRSQWPGNGVQHRPLSGPRRPLLPGAHSAGGADRPAGCAARRTPGRGNARIVASVFDAHRAGNRLRIPAVGRIGSDDSQPPAFAAGRPWIS